MKNDWIKYTDKQPTPGGDEYYLVYDSKTKSLHVAKLTMRLDGVNYWDADGCSEPEFTEYLLVSTPE